MALVPGMIDALLLRGDVDTVASRGVRHFAASGTTTALDVVVFQSLIWSGLVSIYWASAISFCIALVTNYLLASAYVYRHLTKRGTWNWPRFFLYALSGLLSLGLTQIILWLVAGKMGMLPIVAKLVAIVTLFFVNLWTSRRIVFNPRVMPDGSKENK